MPINYTDDLFVNVSNDGMTEDLWNLANDDLDKLKKLNVKSDKERNLLFYLENFIDDLLEEFQVKVNDRDKVIYSTFEYLRDKKNVDLTDIRHAVMLSLRKNKKMAYPNIQGVGEGNVKPQRNITEWIKALGEIYAAVNSGEIKDVAIRRITEGWDPMTKLDFLSWVRYYENGDHEKYQLHRTAAPLQIPTLAQPNVSEEEKDTEIPPVRGPGRPRKTKKTLQQTKMSLISRLDSASRLLREFAGVWPDDVWHRLAQALADLQREIVPLRTVATISDRIIRTAGVWDKFGFSEGAELLRKIAQPPEDVASEIEKALTGKEYGGKPTGGDAEMPPMDMPPTDEMPPGMEEAMPPAGVEEEMPPAETPPETEAVEEKPQEETISVEEGENPFKGKNIQDVLDVLEPLAQKLSEREFTHALSKADMILDSMDIASHFPELAEAQAKALELNLYVLSRLKSIINKLKGGMKEKSSEKKEAPPVEMGELTETAPTEKEMFEVEEEAAPTAGPTEAPKKAE